MNVLILAAGPAQKVLDENYPSCLTEFAGKPLIQHVIESIKKLKPQNTVVALSSTDVNQYHLDNIVELMGQNCRTLSVGATKGALCTALLATPFIDNELELLILNGNDILDIDIADAVADFRSKRLDAGTIIFDSVHPRYSYVKLNEENLIIEATEKRPISRNATAGVFWFKNGNVFVKAAMSLIQKDAHLDGIFYICPTFNELVLEQKSLGVYKIQSHQYHPLKSQRQIDQYEVQLEK